MRVTGIDHVVLNVEDAERSVAWYCEVLGLVPERLEEWRRGEAPFVSLRVDTTTIIDVFQAPRTGENLDHVALVVEDVDLDELATSGQVDVQMGPADLFGAQGTGRGLYIRDPDGNRVELRTYTRRTEPA